jgi:hypothetical protein
MTRLKAQSSHITLGHITLRVFPSAIMPRKRPLLPLRQQYSRDLKMRVIYQAYTLRKSSEDIAIDLNMPLRVVQRVKKTWAEIGEVCHDRRHKGRPVLLSKQNTKVCYSDPSFTVAYFS